MQGLFRNDPWRRAPPIAYPLLSSAETLIASRAYRGWRDLVAALYYEYFYHFRTTERRPAMKPLHVLGMNLVKGSLAIALAATASTIAVVGTAPLCEPAWAADESAAPDRKSVV